jgi:hypothetical protein
LPDFTKNGAKIFAPPLKDLSGQGNRADAQPQASERPQEQSVYLGFIPDGSHARMTASAGPFPAVTSVMNHNPARLQSK